MTILSANSSNVVASGSATYTDVTGNWSTERVRDSVSERMAEAVIARLNKELFSDDDFLNAAIENTRNRTGQDGL